VGGGAGVWKVGAAVVAGVGATVIDGVGTAEGQGTGVLRGPVLVGVVRVLGGVVFGLSGVAGAFFVAGIFLCVGVGEGTLAAGWEGSSS
jgi:hypothetical protein